MFDKLRNKLAMQKVKPVMEVLGVDMHCHLLPGVDDGSADPDSTYELLKVMAHLGFKKVYLTPHFQAKYPNEEKDIEQRYDALRKEMASKGGANLPKLAGIAGEYRFDDLYARQPDGPRPLTLPGKRLLCEFSRFGSKELPLELFRQFQNQGYSLILAHPERYSYMNMYLPEMKELIDMGVRLQVNTLSLVGFYGETPRQRGYQYIQQGWVDYLGTDMHNMRYASALMEAANDSKLLQTLEHYQFKNNEL